jgi:hypothetical protein
LTVLKYEELVVRMGTAYHDDLSQRMQEVKKAVVVHGFLLHAAKK